MMRLASIATDLHHTSPRTTLKLRRNVAMPSCVAIAPTVIWQTPWRTPQSTSLPAEPERDTKRGLQGPSLRYLGRNQDSPT